MRTSIFLLALIASLAFGVADAKPGKDSPSAQVQSCDVVRDRTKGLYGACVSFCAKQQGNANVNLNDIASVKASASNVRDLNRYNELMREGDPGMPCMPSSGTPLPPGEEDEPPPPPPPPATSCPCWSGTDGALQLASIDGVTGGDSSFKICTPSTNTDGAVYKNEVREGDDAIPVVGVAWAAVKVYPSRYNGCFIDTEAGIMDIALGQTDAEQCMREIANQCN